MYSSSRSFPADIQVGTYGYVIGRDFVGSRQGTYREVCSNMGGTANFVRPCFLGAVFLRFLLSAQ